MKTFDTILTACPQHWMRLRANHPNQAPAQHIKYKTPLWSLWKYLPSEALSQEKVYSGRCRSSFRTMAIATSTATGKQTTEALKKWFSILSMPEDIQRDTGSHFTVTTMQYWVQGERKEKI